MDRADNNRAPTAIFNQSATHFTLPLYLRGDTAVDGGLIIDLGERLLSTLLLPGTRAVELHTKGPGETTRLSIGEFSAPRWRAAQKKAREGALAYLGIRAETPEFPNQQIRLSAHVNPAGYAGLRVSGDITVECSVPYLRHLAAAPARVAALVDLAKAAWNGTPGGPAYGYGHLAIALARPAFDPRRPTAALPWEYIAPPDERPHPVPIAYVGRDIEGNLAPLYCSGKGIKGAYWANFLPAAAVALAGGEAALRGRLNGLRVERLEHGGLLVLATDSPLPDDTAAIRERFKQLHEALQPAFLSREETPPLKRRMLGYFFREYPPLR